MNPINFRFIPLVLLSAIQAATATDFAFTRVSTPGAPGEAEVSLSIVFSGTGVCHAVEERLPGSLATNDTPSAEGVYIPDLHALRWGPFLMPRTTTLTYRVKGPEGTSRVEGTVWTDGLAAFALTGTSVAVSSPVPPVTPPARVAEPVLSPASAATLPADVSIACATPGAQIRYTLDGSLPTAASDLYEGELHLTSGTTLRTRGFKDGMTPSVAAAGSYGDAPARIDGVRSFTRVSTPGAPGEAEVSLSVVFSGTGVCHAVEERLPGSLATNDTPSAEGVYIPDLHVLRWGPFLMPTTTTLTYRVKGPEGACRVEGTVWTDGFAAFALTGTSVAVSSPVPSVTPPARVAAPVLSPASAATLPADVSIACATPGAQIRYTLDGSLPTAASDLYEGELHLTSGTTLRARGFKDGMTPSVAVCGLYATAPLQAAAEVDFQRGILVAGGAVPVIAVTATVLSGEAVSYSVTETVALGLVPSAITESGVWDERDRSIRWGPFDDGQSRLLAYRVGSMDEMAGVYALDGAASLNGRLADIAGTDQVELMSGPGWASSPQPPDHATGISRGPVFSWTNPSETFCNAVYLSTNEASVAGLNEAVRVQFDGATAWSDYRTSTLLVRGAVYFWRVVEYDAQGNFSAGPVWQFAVKAPPPDYGQILSEGFEHGGAMPSGWSQAYVLGSCSWNYQSGGQSSQPASAHGGSYNARLYYANSGGAKTRLITPPLNLADGGMRLSFWHAQVSWGGDQDRLAVYYKTSADGAWTLIPGASFTSGVSVWTHRVFDLPGASSTYYIAFEGDARYGYGVCIDDVSVYSARAALGTPYGWLLQYNLIDGGLDFDQAEVLDGDGDLSPNWEEFVADTNPTNAASVFRILGVDPGPPVTVTFEPASTNRDYILQSVDDLANGVWGDVPGQGLRLGGEGVDAMEDEGEAPVRFYRIRVELP